MYPGDVSSEGLQVPRTQYEYEPMYTVVERDHLGPSLLEAVFPDPAPPSPSTRDIRDMSMSEYAAFRRKDMQKEVDLQNLRYSGTYNGKPTKTPFDKYLDARESYIQGTGTLDAMLLFVRWEDDEKYDNIFELDPAYKQREPGSGRPARRRLRRRNRGDLGRTGDRQDDPSSALSQRPGAARRSPMGLYW